MKIIIFCLLILFNISLGITSDEKIVHDNSQYPSGILVKVTDINSLKEIGPLAKSEGLTKKTYYPKLHLQYYSYEKTDNDEKKLTHLCDEITKIKGVVYCELNKKLKPDQSCENRTTTLNVLSDRAVGKLEELKDKLTVCRLILKAENHKDQLSGLSDYWAQEYTGADLLRSLLIEKKDMLKKSDQLVDILDTDHLDHGISVSNLISGPNASAIIPSKRSESIYLSDNAEDYAAYVNEKITKNKFPSFINNSMGWRDSQTIFDSIKMLSDNKVNYISSAGNSGSQVEELKRKAARELNVILVANTTFRGVPDTTSSFADEVAISAPSDSEVISFDEDGIPTRFGGTSGAAPQVTSALASFELITGHHLTKNELLSLLKNTAIKTVNSYDSNFKYGAGLLNAYKIGRTAFKLRELCSSTSSEGQDACMKSQLSKESAFIFPENKLGDAKKAFGNCFQGSGSAVTDLSCSEKQKYFNEIRQEALLNPGRKDLWEGISCIYKDLGYTKNASYFALVAQTQTLKDFKSIDSKLITNLVKDDAIEKGARNSSLSEYMESESSREKKRIAKKEAREAKEREKKISN